MNSISANPPGMVIGLIALSIVVAILVVLYRSAHDRRNRGKAAAKPGLSPSSTSLPPHLVAVLTAAAVAAIGRRVTVRRITFINRDTVSGWATAGRTSIQMSHNLRRTM